MIVRIFKTKVASYTRTPTDCVHWSLVTVMDHSNRDDSATRSSEVSCTTCTRSIQNHTEFYHVPHVALYRDHTNLVSPRN